ncbi:hypothetical protein COJ88_29305 [Bacillus cereus]|nr:hypothetical protein F8510_27350 [Bacillus sp. RM2(2019)]PFK63130.1 hypothetical protein COJ25_29615 [Bacillus cereus]PGV58799.1 hypothetical protein COD96_31340 [Bacillus thuringiensis]PFM73993.1 hypothetical protein COJ54_24190 [Bacillus cereus]PFO84670.1 hypothetical protein COJ88_29305 [Bacillus cereus]
MTDKIPTRVIVHRLLKSKAFWLRQTKIHLPPIVGLRPSHACGRRILSGNMLKHVKHSSSFIVAKR